MHNSQAILLGLTLIVSLGCSSPPPVVESVRIGLFGEPAHLDPHLQNDAISMSALFNAYEALTVFDSEMVVGPALAESWETIEDTTWRFRLREPFFHNGQKLTARDVVYSLNRARTGSRSRVSDYLVAVEGLSAESDRWVVIETKVPTTILLNKLSFIAIVPEGWDGGESIGTGPVLFGADRRRRSTHGQCGLLGPRTPGSRGGATFVS